MNLMRTKGKCNNTKARKDVNRTNSRRFCAHSNEPNNNQTTFYLKIKLNISYGIVRIPKQRGILLFFRIYCKHKLFLCLHTL